MRKPHSAQASLRVLYRSVGIGMRAHVEQSTSRALPSHLYRAHACMTTPLQGGVDGARPVLREWAKHRHQGKPPTTVAPSRLHSHGHKQCACLMFLHRLCSRAGRCFTNEINAMRHIAGTEAIVNIHNCYPSGTAVEHG